jgi:hypothetical protein
LVCLRLTYELVGTIVHCIVNFAFDLLKLCQVCLDFLWLL